MAILMLCNKQVYDIAADTMLDTVFCPFLDSEDTKKAYERWRGNRIYLKTNRTAERIVKQAGGIGTREAKRRLSLSDAYWVKYKYDADTVFESITPYLNSFSEASIVRGSARSSSVPDLVLGGSQPKRWKRGADGGAYLCKSEEPIQIKAEMLAVKMLRKCGVRVMNAFIQTDRGRVYADRYTVSQDVQNIGVINLVNMSNENRSMLQFDQLGIWVDGYDPASVERGYRQAGVAGDVTDISVLQVVSDAIVGNIDRETNNSNWAIFMNNITGERVPSWMYDFNWANLSAGNDEQLREVAANIKKIGAKAVSAAMSQARSLRGACAELGLAVWEENARRLIDILSMK